jgi:hypothetical protein
MRWEAPKGQVVPEVRNINEEDPCADPLPWRHPCLCKIRKQSTGHLVPTVHRHCPRCWASTHRRGCKQPNKPPQHRESNIQHLRQDQDRHNDDLSKGRAITRCLHFHQMCGSRCPLSLGSNFLDEWIRTSESRCTSCWIGKWTLSVLVISACFASVSHIDFANSLEQLDYLNKWKHLTNH